jgi:hypothetical protein
MAEQVFEHNSAYAKPEDLLPHGDPILLVSGLTELHRDEQGRTQRVEGFLTPGPEHFVGNIDALRWMKLIEALAQTGAAGQYQDNLEAGIPPEEQPSPLFKSIQVAHFGESGRKVALGDTIHMDVKLLQGGKNFTGEGVAKVGDDIVCTAIFGGKLMSPRLTDAFYDGLQGVKNSVNKDEFDAEVRSHGGPNFFEKPVWLTAVTKSNPNGLEGIWLPEWVDYQGHEFGEKKEGETIVRPATPILPGIKQVGTLEDLASLRLSNDGVYEMVGVMDVEFNLPIVLGQKAVSKVMISDGAVEGHKTVEGIVTLPDDDGVDSFRTKAVLEFAKAA